MIDIHSHLLPGVDDGASSMQVAVDMLAIYAQLGFTKIVATPHLVAELDSVYREAVRDALDLVAPYAKRLGLQVVQGYEIRLNPEVPRFIEAAHPITMGYTNVVLTDLAGSSWPSFTEDIIFQIQSTGCKVILAHPERYTAIQQHPEMALDLFNRGVILQTTIGSYCGAFGRRAKKAAETLLDLQVVQVVATDAHSAGDRMAAVPDGLQRLEDLLGVDQLRCLLIDAPNAILAGSDLPQPVQPISRSWRNRLPFLRSAR